MTVQVFFKNDRHSQAAKYAVTDALESGNVAVSFRGETLAAKHVPASTAGGAEPGVEAVAQPTAEPVPVSEPEPAAEPTAEAAAEPVTEPEPELAAEPERTAVPELAAEAVVEPAAAPEPEPPPEPEAAEPRPQPREDEDLVLQAETDDGAPGTGFIEVNLPMKETDGEFGAKDGFTMYVDGARFVPESLAVTNVTVTALSRDLQQQGVARMTGLVYGTDPVCPGFAFRHVYRYGSRCSPFSSAIGDITNC